MKQTTKRTAEDTHSSYTWTTVTGNEAKQWLKPETKKGDLPGSNYDMTLKQDVLIEAKECQKWIYMTTTQTNL